jgi:hypothetical protein
MGVRFVTARYFHDPCGQSNSTWCRGVLNHLLRPEVNVTIDDENHFAPLEMEIYGAMP